MTSVDLPVGDAQLAAAVTTAVVGRVRRSSICDSRSMFAVRRSPKFDSDVELALACDHEVSGTDLTYYPPDEPYELHRGFARR